MYQEVHSSGEAVINICSVPLSNDIRAQLTSLDMKWITIKNKLVERHTQLNTMMDQWTGAETYISDILAWLKHVRSELKHPLPHTYDDILTDLDRCRVS